MVGMYSMIVVMSSMTTTTGSCSFSFGFVV